MTHDIPEPVDSLAGFIIPLCYTHNNPSLYCSLSSFWNSFIWNPNYFYRNIFRHLPDNEHPQIHNWMMDQWQEGNGEEWNGIILDLEGTSHFYLHLFAFSSEDQLYGAEEHVLLATMTFRVEDTMTITIDTSFWPPGDRLTFTQSDGESYIPMHNFPYTFSVSCPVRGNPTGGINGDCQIDVGDIIFLIGYLYKNAPPPDPLERGDANCDGVVDIGDVIYLINYLFKGGPAPFC